MNWVNFAILLCALAAFVLFVQAMLLSRAVEKLLGEAPPAGFGMRTHVLASAFGRAGEDDPQVRALRARLRARLAALAALFLLMWVLVA